MTSSKRSALLSSLAAYGDDSEQDSDPDPDSDEPESESHGGLVSASYGVDDVSRVEEEDEKGSENEDSDDSARNSEEEESDSGRAQDNVKDVQEWETKDPQELVAQFSEKVRNMSPDEIKIPPEPPGRCSSHLQEKIIKLYERKLHEDFDTNKHIQKKKEFRNPSIYEKLIQFCGIDELGTNYPKDMFDPHGWSEDSYYEALAKAQKVEMDKLEKAKKEKTKIEFVTGTKKGTTTNAAAMTTNTTTASSAADAQKRKSKWDSAVPVTLAQPALLTTTTTLPGVVSVTTTASGTKTTVISAVGTILKKAKQ
ncbi:SAP30-binding protein-like isoform X1 [Myxocyprinus asiaticus]|uniref:SAP30-binding protein-like isoform X1 n=1 Tax=Myxocyprinus asiaticus TaxID=70543 RepID=UPI002221C3CC|nr:SAP30-binding protein-like isoform X1 [Myxocyprinus asiaticus]